MAVSAEAIIQEADTNMDNILAEANKHFKEKNNWNKVALYPGSFDPMTFAHRKVIEQVSPLFDKIYVAILENANKTPRYGELRKKMAEITVADSSLTNVEVVYVDYEKEPKTTLDLCKELGAGYIIRGLRSTSDVPTEASYAQVIHRLVSSGSVHIPQAKILWVPPIPGLEFMSSSLARELIDYKKFQELSLCVHSDVAALMIEAQSSKE